MYMDINEDYLLPVNNYNDEVFTKNKIIIGNSGTNSLNHIPKWLNRLNGYNKKTAAFTVSKDGKVYKHYNPKYYSNFIKDESINRESIPIVLENEGWLIKKFRSNEYVNWIGDIYNKEYGVIDIKWRGKRYWAKYNDKQIQTLTTLCNKLCEEFKIPLKPLKHNVKGELNNYKGITYRSNYDRSYTDISPAFDINNFINKL